MDDTRIIENRVALVVAYDGAEDVWLDVDVGTDLTRLELSLAQLFGSEEKNVERLWTRIGGGVMEVIGEADPPHPQPIGGLLGRGELHMVTLAVFRPITRGR